MALLIEYIITIGHRKNWWRAMWARLSPTRRTRSTKAINESVKRLLPSVAGEKPKGLPTGFEDFTDRVVTGYVDTFRGANIWWIEGYPEGEGNFIILVQPHQVPNHVDEFTLAMFSAIERRLEGYEIAAHKLNYSGVARVFSIQEPTAPFWVPESIAFVLVAAVSGLWFAFVERIPASHANQKLYEYVLNILVGVLGSAIASFIVALITWRVRKRQARRGRKVVYQDGR